MKSQADVFSFSHLLKAVTDIGDCFYYIGFFEEERHLPFIYFAQVHQLVYQPENAVGIAVYEVIYGLSLFILVTVY